MDAFGKQQVQASEGAFELSEEMLESVVGGAIVERGYHWRMRRGHERRWWHHAHWNFRHDWNHHSEDQNHLSYTGREGSILDGLF